jgi:HTH-type transcriptional regulator/antitoxin HigA
MITNERQYKISKQQFGKIRDAIRNLDLEKLEEMIGSSVLAAAELNALKSEQEVLSEQLREYEALQSGIISEFSATSLEELPTILIRARIAQQLTQRELGDMIGVKEQQIQRYEASLYSGASLRRLNEIAKALRLNIRELAQIEERPIKPGSSPPNELDWSRFPAKEMYRRNWFEGFDGTLGAVLDQSNSYVRNYIQSVFNEPARALYRRRIRNGSAIDQYALLAWECRILKLAQKENIRTTFNDKDLTDQWIANLVNQSKEPDGPIRARKMLRDIGIPLIIEPHLSKTHIDGAALLYQGKPVIGMTLRYDRIDNFWFVLLHELFHILKHLKEGEFDSIIDDLEAASDDDIEQEADKLAREALIPSEVWNQAICRFVRTNRSVRIQASELRINPGIVAGRIRFETNNYTILNDLVGYGEVRKHFLDAGFGT